jgi:hypothetical protein
MDEMEVIHHDNDKEKIELMLQMEYESIINKKWYFLHNEYMLEKRGYHRTELIEINHINKMGNSQSRSQVFIIHFVQKF